MKLRRLRRLLRWTAGGFTALVLVALALLMTLDLSRYRTHIEAAASAATGRELVIEGDIELAGTFPPKLALEEVRLANAPWARDAHLLRSKRLLLGFSPADLLAGQIVVTGLEALDFDLSLEVREAGPPSWRLAEGQESRVPTSIVMRSGTVRFLDAEHEWSAHVDRISARFEEDSARISVRGRFRDRDAAFEIESDERYTRARAEPIPVRFAASLGDVELSGSGRFSYAGDRPSLRARVELDAESLADLDLAGLGLPDTGALALEGELEAGRHRLAMPSFSVRLGGALLAGSLDIDAAGDRPALHARLEMESLDLDEARSRWRGEAAIADPFDAALLPGASPVDLDAMLVLGSLRAGGVELGKTTVGLELTGSDARLRIESGAASAARASLGVDVTESPPAWTLEAEAGAIDYARAASIVGISQGAAAWPRAERTMLALRATGETARELIESLRGEAQIEGVRFFEAGEEEGPLHLQTLVLAARDGRALDLRAAGELDGERFNAQAAIEGPLLELERWPVTGVLEGRGARLAARGEIERPFGTRTLVFEVELSAPSLARLLGAAEGDAKPVPVTAQGKLRGDAHELALTELRGSVGGSAFSGRLLRAPGAPRPKLSAALEVQRLNLAELFSATAAEGAGGAWQERLRAFDGEVELAVSSISDASALDGLALTARLDDGRLSVDPLVLRVKGGEVRGALAADLGETPPRYRLEAETDGLDLDGLWPALIGGRLESVALSAGARGTRREELLGSLSLEASAEGVGLALDLGGSRLAPEDLRLRAEIDPDSKPTLTLTGRIRETPFELSAIGSSSFSAGGPMELRLAVDSADLALQASGSLERPLAPSGVTFRLDASGPDLAWWNRVLESPLPIGGPYEVEGDVAYADGTLTIRELAASLDGHRVSGTLELEPAARRYRAALSSPELVVARASERAPAQPDEERRLIPSVPLANLMPAGWEGEASWEIGTLRFGDHLYDRIALSGRWSRMGDVTLSASARSEDTGGSLRADFSHDPTAWPASELRLDADRIDLGWLFPQDGGIVHWPADIEAEVSGPGRSLDELLALGDGRIAFAAGRTRGESARFDRWKLSLLSLMVPPLGEGEKDNLTCLAANVALEHGLAEGEGAILETHHVSVGIGGIVDLATEQLGLVLTPKPRETTFLNVATTVQVSGTLAAPKVSPAPADIALTSGKLLLGIANPFMLVGALIASTSVAAENPCAAALERAREEVGEGETMAGAIEETLGSATGGLFSFVPDALKRGQAPTGAAPRSAQ